MQCTQTKLTAHIDRGFSYITAPLDDSSPLPPVVARDLQPEYAILFAAAPLIFNKLLAICDLDAGNNRPADRNAVCKAVESARGLITEIRVALARNEHIQAPCQSA